MGESHVHLVVPSFIDGSKMLGKLLNYGNENKANEAVRNSALPHDERNLLHQVDGNDCDQGDSNTQSENTFGEGKFLFLLAFILLLLVLLLLEDGVIDTLVRPDLEIDVDDVRDDKEARRDA